MAVRFCTDYFGREEIDSMKYPLLIAKYGKAVVVFDGYSSASSTKDATHNRRAQGFLHPEVRVSRETKFVGKKELF